jgi:hypothetical protein
MCSSSEPIATAGRILAIVTLTAVVACGAKDTGTLKSQDAARWLYQTCGIRFAQDPVILKNTWAGASAMRGRSGSVSATVALPSAEVAAALEALRNNPSLHRRGQSDSRYSYESLPEAAAEKECELDTSLHVLYFRYTE